MYLDSPEKCVDQRRSPNMIAFMRSKAGRARAAVPRSAILSAEAHTRVSKSMNRVTDSKLSITNYHTEILTIVQDMKYTKYCIIYKILHNT